MGRETVYAARDDPDMIAGADKTKKADPYREIG
jgi:hypothetical protein